MSSSRFGYNDKGRAEFVGNTLLEVNRDLNASLNKLPELLSTICNNLWNTGQAADLFNGQFIPELNEMIEVVNKNMKLLVDTFCDVCIATDTEDENKIAPFRRIYAFAAQTIGYRFKESETDPHMEWQALENFMKTDVFMNLDARCKGAASTLVTVMNNTGLSSDDVNAELQGFAEALEKKLTETLTRVRDGVMNVVNEKLGRRKSSDADQSMQIGGRKGELSSM